MTSLGGSTGEVPTDKSSNFPAPKHRARHPWVVPVQTPRHRFYIDLKGQVGNAHSSDRLHAVLLTQHRMRSTSRQCHGGSMPIVLTLLGQSRRNILFLSHELRRDMNLFMRFAILLPNTLKQHSSVLPHTNGSLSTEYSRIQSGITNWQPVTPSAGQLSAKLLAASGLPRDGGVYATNALEL